MVRYGWLALRLEQVTFAFCSISRRISVSNLKNYFGYRFIYLWDILLISFFSCSLSSYFFFYLLLLAIYFFVINYTSISENTFFCLPGFWQIENWTQSLLILFSYFLSIVEVRCLTSFKYLFSLEKVTLMLFRSVFKL